MASRQPSKSIPHHHFPWSGLLLLLLMMVFIGSFLRTDSFTSSEAMLSWLIQPDSGRDLLPRWRETGYPPLYPALLKGWSMLFGSGEYVLRWPTLAVSLLSVALSFACVRQITDAARGTLAMALLGGLSILLGYGLRADGMAWAVLLAWLATWRLLLRVERKSLGRWRRIVWVVLYAGCVGALLYSHYAGVLVIVAHGVTVLIVRRRWGLWLGAAAVVMVLWVPWVVWARAGFANTFINQLIGTIPIFLATLLVIVVLRGLPGLIRWQRWVYVVWAGVMAAALILLPRPTDWRGVIARIARERDPFEPIVTDFAPTSVQAYYDRMYGLSRGIAVRLGWQDLTGEELGERLAPLVNSAAIWIMVKSSQAETWGVIELLQEQRRVTFQSQVEDYILMRFE
jgi:hypothetical protein